MIFFSFSYSSSLSTSESRAKTPLPDSFECSSTPSEVSTIPCVLALLLKNRDFFCYGEIFLPNTRGPLGCLLGFWPSGPKPCGGNYLLHVTRLFHSIKLICRNLYALLKAYTANQNGVQLFSHVAV